MSERRLLQALIVLGAVLSSTCLGSDASKGTEPLSIGQLIDLTLENDASLRSVSIKSRANQHAINASKWQRLPELKLGLNAMTFDGSPVSMFSLNNVQDADNPNGEANWDEFGSLALSLNYTLYGGGKVLGQDIALYQQRKLQLEQSEVDLQDLKIQRARTVTQYAIQWLYNQSLIELLRAKFSQLQRLQHWTQLEFDTGQKDSSDLESVNEQLTETEIDLDATRNQSRTLEALIRLLAVEVADADIRISRFESETYLRQRLDAMMSRIASSNPAIRQSQLKSEEAAAMIQGLKNENRPEISLQSTYNEGINFDQNNAALYTVGIRVDIPITEAFGRMQEIKSSRSLRQAALAEEQALRRELQLEVIQLKQAFNELEGSRKRLESKIRVRSAEIQQLELKFKQSLIQESDLLEKQLALAELQMQLLGKRYEEIMLLADIAVRTGNTDLL